MGACARIPMKTMTAAELQSCRGDRDRARRALARRGADAAPATTPSAAVALAGRHDIDLHLAVELLEQRLPDRARRSTSCSSRPGARDARAESLVPVLLASIPSPHSGTIDLGPLTIHMYGLMLLLAIAAAIWLTGVRWVRARRRLGPRPARRGLGRRVRGSSARGSTTTSRAGTRCRARSGRASSRSGRAGSASGAGSCSAASPARWSSGARAQRIARFMDAVAPGLLLAQGIGRWGNWWNQELYGKPTDLPWGLEIDADAPPARLRAVLDLPPDLPLRVPLRPRSASACCSCVDRRFRIRPPALFALYVSIYTFGRFFEELLRIDPAHHFAGLRLNAWVSVVVFCVSTAFFIWWQFIRERRAPGAAEPRPRRCPRARRWRSRSGRVRPSR